MAGPASPFGSSAEDDSEHDAAPDPPERRDAPAQADRGEFLPGASSPLEEPFSDEDPSASEEEREERFRRRLLAPIGRLYALAQSLSHSEREARQLVEATYARAADELDAGTAPASDEAARAWLYSMLIDVARKAPDHRPRAGEASDDADGGRHFRRLAQHRFLRRTLPSAFAALDPEQRLLLTLCDIERFAVPEAADVAGLSPQTTRDQLERARADLRTALRQMAPRPERPFLEEAALPEERLRDALRQMAKHDLSSPPPALRPAARRALHRELHTPPPHSDRAPSASESAPDRSPAPSDDGGSRPAWHERLPRLVVALLLIGVAGGIAFLTTSVLNSSSEKSLATLSAQRADDVNVRLRTDQPERAEQYVHDEFGRRLTVPHIEGTTLLGVGVAEVLPGERVPVFLFRDSASGRPVTTYAYDYALLDRAGERLHLATDLRNQLAEEGRFATQDVEDRRVHLWRHRDDIFAAVTVRADSLQQRIRL